MRRIGVICAALFGVAVWANEESISASDEEPAQGDETLGLTHLFRWPTCGFPL